MQKVWLVYQEFQADTPDIVGLFESRRDAERSADECRRCAREDHQWVVYGDVNEDGDEIAAWDVDLHVEGHDIEPARPSRRRRGRGASRRRSCTRSGGECSSSSVRARSSKPSECPTRRSTTKRGSKSK
jgi:hypothetical protein